MKLAILGGSFNPVHIGHLFLADSVLCGLGYDRLVLVPAFESPFKIGAEAASPRDRLDMLAASIPADPRLTIDDCEINRQGVSYTIDTLKDIIARYRPDGKPGLVLGDDLASTFYRWRSPGEIAELSDIIIARRIQDTSSRAGSNGNSPSGKKSAGADEFACNGGNDDGKAGKFPYPHKTLDNEIINVSSRMVREKIGRAEAWHFLVPQGARCIIEDRALYGFTPAAGTPPPTMNPIAGKGGLSEAIVHIENDVRNILDFRRFMHSRNTALLSWDLCRRFGLDPQKGYLAGITHDICKAMGEKELIHLARSDGRSFSRMEQAKPGLLHGRAGAVFIRKKYGITDEDIIESIQYHTTGKKEMGALSKVVYIADKIEISRNGVDSDLRKMSLTVDLETLFRAVLDNTIAYLKSRKLDISYDTRKLLSAMKKRNSF